MSTRASATSTPRSVAASWRVIEDVLGRTNPALLRALRPPAKPEAVDALEGVLGRRLPPDMRSSLRTHDGMRASYLGVNRLFDYEALLGTKEIATVWRMMVALEDTEGFRDGDPATRGRKIRNDRWWRRGWVPVTDADGDRYVLDLEPGPQGHLGQVFRFYNSGGRPRTVRAASYRAWLDGVARTMARGHRSRPLTR